MIADTSNLSSQSLMPEGIRSTHQLILGESTHYLPGNSLCPFGDGFLWPFGKVKWTPTRESKGHFESPGTGFFVSISGGGSPDFWTINMSREVSQWQRCTGISLHVITGVLESTPLKINMEQRKTPNWKGKSSSKSPLLCSMFIFQGVLLKTHWQRWQIISTLSMKFH